MKLGFYYSPIFKCIILVIRNSSLGNFDMYEILSSTSIRLLGQVTGVSMILARSRFIMPFDHYPTFDELSNLPELFI